MPPQVGSSVEIERFTKERIASTITAIPISSDRSATIVGSTFGSTSFRRIVASEKPAMRALSTIIHAALTERLGAHDAAEADPVDRHDGDDDGVEPGAEHRDEQDGEKHRRERHPDIDDPRHDLVEPAAIIAGE